MTASADADGLHQYATARHSEFAGWVSRCVWVNWAFISVAQLLKIKIYTYLVFTGNFKLQTLIALFF